MAERVIFVSCGQRTADEVVLGREVAQVIANHGMRAFFAQDVHSAGDLNSEVFRAIQACDGFVGILQKRGVVTFADYPPVERSSVWIQQEIAIFCYRMSLEGRSLPIRVYSERGIRREGVMEIAVVNPIEFENPEGIPSEVDKWLGSREFEVHPALATREDMFRRRFNETDGEQRLVLELLVVHCLEAGESADYGVVNNDFVTILMDQGLPVEAAHARFSHALGRLRELALVARVEGRGGLRLQISKQWGAPLGRVTATRSPPVDRGAYLTQMRRPRLKR